MQNNIKLRKANKITTAYLHEKQIFIQYSAHGKKFMNTWFECVAL